MDLATQNLTETCYVDNLNICSNEQHCNKDWVADYSTHKASL